jgi:chorismate mutase
MAIIEVDEDDYKISATARALMDKMANKPEQRQRLLKLVKETAPELHIPEIDQLDPIRTDLAKVRDELMGEVQGLKKAREEEATNSKISAKIESERTKLRKQGWDDEGIAKVEARMQQEGFVNYAAAAALVEKEETKPATFGDLDSYDKSWNFFAPGSQEEEGSYKDLLASPNGWKKFQNQEVRKFFDDKRAGRL